MDTDLFYRIRCFQLSFHLSNSRMNDTRLDLAPGQSGRTLNSDKQLYIKQIEFNQLIMLYDRDYESQTNLIL